MAQLGDNKITANDIVKALTESNLLNKQIETIEYDSAYDTKVIISFEESHEYIGDDEVKYNDIHLIVYGNGKWTLEHISWCG